MTHYRHLYIYEIGGTVDDKSITSSDYIGCWNEGGSSFLFFHAAHGDLVEAFVGAQPGLTLVDSYDMDYEEWQGGGLEPFRVGSLWFCPPEGDIVQKPKGCRLISFDPGVVFGTGLHPTTYDTLHLINDVFKAGIPETVLDLGTGTGILALACAYLGAGKVIAVDVNRLSVKTAAENVRLNQLEDVISVREASAEDTLAENADFAVMNIHYQVLDALCREEAFFDKRRIILSGLLRSDYLKLLKKVRKGFRLVDERSTGHWFSAWFER
jgi:ribosomal protein L11 methyltransferase